MPLSKKHTKLYEDMITKFRVEVLPQDWKHDATVDGKTRHGHFTLTRHSALLYIRYTYTNYNALKATYRPNNEVYKRFNAFVERRLTVYVDDLPE